MRLGYIKELNGFRALAVLMVLVFHWIGGQFGFLNIQLGTLGVYMFFVLSSFLITNILLELRGSPNAFKTFYFRRALRIFPIYYLLLASLWVINYEDVRNDVIYYALYLQNLHFYAHDVNNMIGHLWSLSVEEHYYLLWPFVVFSVNVRVLKNISLGLVLIGPFAHLAYYCLTGHYSFALTPFALEGFAWGSLAALRFKGIEPGSNKMPKPMIGLVVGLGILLGYSFLASLAILDIKWIERMVFSFFSFALLEHLIYKRKSIITRVLGLKLLIEVGKISYGIYLFHRMVPDLYFYLHKLCVEYELRIPYFDYILLPYLGHPDLMFLIYFPIVLFMAKISYLLIERPFLNLKNIYSR